MAGIPFSYIRSYTLYVTSVTSSMTTLLQVVYYLGRAFSRSASGRSFLHSLTVSVNGGGLGEMKPMTIPLSSEEGRQSSLLCICGDVLARVPTWGPVGLAPSLGPYCRPTHNPSPFPPPPRRLAACTALWRCCPSTTARPTRFPWRTWSSWAWRWRSDLRNLFRSGGSDLYLI